MSLAQNKFGQAQGAVQRAASAFLRTDGLDEFALVVDVALFPLDHGQMRGASPKGGPRPFALLAP